MDMARLSGAEGTAAPGKTESARAQVRRWLGFALPRECEVGVEANLAALEGHAALVRATLDRLGDRHRAG